VRFTRDLVLLGCGSGARAAQGLTVLGVLHGVEYEALGASGLAGRSGDFSTKTDAQACLRISGLAGESLGEAEALVGVRSIGMRGGNAGKELTRLGAQSLLKTFAS
jgi:hypothetical protein